VLPAKKNGRIATAGVAPMYSSWLGVRAASVSARPYMKTVNRTDAATNQNAPAAVMSNVAPRSAATAISTTTWNAASASTTTRFDSTSSALGIGAARSSFCAPLWRSTITLSPAKIAASGTSSPTVPTDTNAM
jgi:hypothetical protein